MNQQSNQPVYQHAQEPWAPYYLYQNPGWATPHDAYSRWKLGSSRKQTAIDTWNRREKARARYESGHGVDPASWPMAHPTTIVWPTNLPEAVCLRCLWIDGRHWEEVGARASAALHSVLGAASEDAPAADVEAGRDED